jgi:DNA-directed RNA polymerase subunit beta'
VVVDSENGIPFFTPLYVRKPKFLLIHHIHQEVFREHLKFPLAQIGMFLEAILMPIVYRNLQKFLNKSSDTMVAASGAGSAGNETSTFGPATKAAVIKFQEKYAADILTPSGLSKGTGNWFAATRAKANALCTTTDGSADIAEMFRLGGKELVEEYIISEINKVYELQSASISRKHTEIIVRQMFSRRRIKDAGETNFSAGDIVENTAFMEENARVEELGGKKATAEIVVLGITEVSLRTKSWLSAASFQNTNRVLIENAIKGGVDSLRGLKENVIIGRLIPAGTGFKNNFSAAKEE